MMKRLLVVGYISLVASFFTFFVPAVKAQIPYANGIYTNVCGTGTAATSHTCMRGCSTGSGSCSSNQAAVLKFVCDGRQTECRQNESSFSTSQSIGNPGCGKTVQIDVFNQNCRSKGGWSCTAADLQDYVVWYSGDCPATPYSSEKPVPIAAAPKPTQPNTPPAQPIEHRSSCDTFEVISGNDSVLPAKVMFKTTGTDTKDNIKMYKYYYGDGTIEELATPEVTHTYKVSGRFNARVDIKDSQGAWKTSTACQTEVRVRQTRLESHKADCADVTWTADNQSQAPATVTFQIRGYDNKGNIQQYKLDFGNGIIKEGSGAQFEQRYESAGTFDIKAYIKDSQGNWHGGDDNCQRSLYINTKSLTEQPNTGSPTLITVAAVMSGISGLGTLLASRKRQ